jgi:hypothetical protein
MAALVPRRNKSAVFVERHGQIGYRPQGSERGRDDAIDAYQCITGCKPDCERSSQEGVKCDGWVNGVSQWPGGVCRRPIRARDTSVLVATMVAEAGREEGLSADQREICA